MAKYEHISFQKSWEITPEIAELLGESKAIITAISNTPLSPEYHTKLLNVSLIRGAQATTAIEGNTLTTEEIQNIQAGRDLPPSKAYQQVEVKNILDAFNIIRDRVVNLDKSEIITPDLIKEYNRMVGENLGEHFQAIPGAFRKNNVFVGTYRAPDYEDVEALVTQFCSWLRTEFHFEKEDQSFSTAIIQAIVTHVYIEWIHPFGDGNGRTGRLLEFYLLMRAGNPDIASHILSNHYNLTRNEYYRQLQKSVNSRTLTDFISYALVGFKDGLYSSLELIQANQFKLSWRSWIYDKFIESSIRSNIIFKRIRRIMLDFPLQDPLTIDQIYIISPVVARELANISTRTLRRYLDDLIEMGLLIKEGDKYFANIDSLSQQLPLRKKRKQIREYLPSLDLPINSVP